MQSSPTSPNKTLNALANSSFCRVADARQFDGNSVQLLRDGPNNFQAWLVAISKAEQTVYLENYILQEDVVGQSFADALADAVRRGVKCRVLYDWLGCRTRTSETFWQAMRSAGIEVRCYNRLRLSNPLLVISRNHRKVLCVDSYIAFTGGLCIGHDWVGDPDRGIPPWRDTAIKIEGPAAAYLSMSFADSWRESGPPIPEDLPQPGMIATAGDVGLWVIAGRPDSMGLYRLEQLVADIVEQSLWLTDAYFVATTGYVRSLTGAARAGVDVRLLVPSASDLPVVRALSQSAYRPLLESGVRVFEWNGPMMHAKTAVADGCWSRVGSSNSNLASWITNRELDVTIDDTRFAAEMEAMFEQDLENAAEVILRSGHVRVSAPIGNAGRRQWRRQPGSLSRVLAGAVGLGSVVGAMLTRHRQLGTSEWRIIAFAGLVLAIFALAALGLPRQIGYALGGLATWFSVTLLAYAWKLRRSDQPTDKPKDP